MVILLETATTIRLLSNIFIYAFRRRFYQKLHSIEKHKQFVTEPTIVVYNARFSRTKPEQKCREEEDELNFCEFLKLKHRTVMGMIRRDCMNWSNVHISWIQSLWWSVCQMQMMPPEQSWCRMQNISYTSEIITCETTARHSEWKSNWRRGQFLLFRITGKRWSEGLLGGSRSHRPLDMTELQYSYIIQRNCSPAVSTESVEKCRKMRVKQLVRSCLMNGRVTMFFFSGSAGPLQKLKLFKLFCRMPSVCVWVCFTSDVCQSLISMKRVCRLNTAAL